MAEKYAVAVRNATMKRNGEERLRFSARNTGIGQRVREMNDIERNAERAEKLIKRMCKLMGWDYKTSPLWTGIRKVAVREAVPIGLDKLEAVVRRLERLPSQWRKISEFLANGTEMDQVKEYARAMRRCADDLEEAMRAGVSARRGQRTKVRSTDTSRRPQWEDMHKLVDKEQAR
jgi:hypothetical protein